MHRLVILWLVSLFWTGSALAEKDEYLKLARQGWNYELRTTMVGRDLSIPVHINGRDLSGSSICLVGDRPHPASLEVIDAFRALLAHSFGKPVPMRYAGLDARSCGSGRTVVLRLYSGFPPNKALSIDLHWMNDVHQLGLPMERDFAASSPAMAQTFFGRRGLATHIMVKQPAHGRPDVIETAFYKSILVEELFQAFTFGMDIIQFDRSAEFVSKLQEIPMNLTRMSWDSHAFMRALLGGNPGRLCAFDVFMLHAVAQAPVDQTIDDGFIDYIDAQYEWLLLQSDQTMNDPRFAPILDATCAHPI
ncbi:MAG: hypothetical protein ABJ251_08400 [Paracoccaceae bacterium]